jgi:hypothetical protein
MRRRLLTCLAILGTALSVACSMANVGGIRGSDQVTRQFENLEIIPNYRYWYLNQENNPYGVVGLDREYRLDNDPMWQPLDPGAATFRKVVGLVQSFPLPSSTTSGYSIMDPQGRTIGVWYSSLAAGIVVDSETKTVSISTAMPWIFNDDF